MSNAVVPETPRRKIRAKSKTPSAPELPAPVAAAPAPAVPFVPEEAPVLIDWNGAFFAQVRERNTNPDGRLKDADLPRRLSHEICRQCHEQYRRKFPEQPFQIVCEGIYTEPDFTRIAEAAELPYEQVREALDIPYWAERHLKLPNKEGDLAPFVARDYQKEDLWCTAKRKVKRWSRGLGKALSLDTPILSTNGWLTFNTIKPGDFVFAPDGSPVEVTFVSDIMYDHKVYDVEFSDGSMITADAEHLWKTWDQPARAAEGAYRVKKRSGFLAHVRKTPQPGLRTTEQIKATLHTQYEKRVERNHSIKVCAPLAMPQADLLIGPYTLGAWLGDGNHKDAKIACNDLQILQEIQKDGFAVKKNGAPFMYGIGAKPTKWGIGGYVSNDSLHSRLKALNLLGSKHIPEQYFQASIEQRLALLQGLMDTDGTITKKGNCCFDNTNKAIADGVERLALSLGIKTKRKTKQGRFQGKDYKLVYRVQFTTHLPVFRLDRKKSRLPNRTRSTQNHRYIIAVHERPSVPVRCIEVDHLDHLFLAGWNLVPTHNTSCAVAKELHTALHRKRYNTLIALPMKAQAMKWFDELTQAINGDDELADAVAQRRQSPYFTIRFYNKATINLFTTGSKSGSNADSLRSQSPRRVGVDEQDLLNEADWKAIMPLLRRFPDSEFEGSSTPLGKREKFWEMCNVYPDYKETHFPIQRHPDFSPGMEIACRREARTEINYTHEFLAEFGDMEGGVFKAQFVDAAKKHYRYTREKYKAGRIYAMGVDWNGQGTGTRIRIVEFDPETEVRRMVDHSEINSSTADTIQEIRLLNQEWKCRHIFIDAGFGFVQDEILKSVGANAANADDARLKEVQTIDFAAKLITNKLVPNRENNPYKQQEELERPTKPFMVEGMMMALEAGLFEYSDDDKILDEQLRAYRVKNYTRHGWANSYESEHGDHDLDAAMLAMLAIEVNYGMTSRKFELPSALVRHTPGFGAADGSKPVSSADPSSWQTPAYRSTREVTQEKAAVPSRQGTHSPYEVEGRVQAGAQDLYGNMRSFVYHPPAPHHPAQGAVPSRTSGLGGGRTRLTPPKGFRR